MAKEVAKVSDNSLPDYLRDRTGPKKAKIGNTDRSDLIIPRVKLLQGLSPEVVNDVEGAKIGSFWHSIASQNLGKSLRVIPLLIRKSYVLWAPRGDERGVLARAVDGLNWDNAGMEFTVQLKNAPHPIKYKLGRTVHERTGEGPALSEFGSSIPGTSNSAPAAALTYQILFHLRDFPELSPAIIINSRSSVKPAQTLQSKIELRPGEHYEQGYTIGVQVVPTNDGPYQNYTYTADGWASEEEREVTKGLYESLSSIEWQASDERVDEENGGSGGGGGNTNRPGPSDSDSY